MKTTMMDRMVDKESKEPDYEEDKERLEEEQKRQVRNIRKQQQIRVARIISFLPTRSF